jgi:hypothetical protein
VITRRAFDAHGGQPTTRAGCGPLGCGVIPAAGRGRVLGAVRLHEAESTTGDHADLSQQAESNSARRRFLTGGAVAAAAAVGATAFNSSPAQAQSGAQFVYLPVPPVRVFDSRTDGGRISTGQVQTLFTQPLDTDLAYCFNLTVTQTTSSGWLAIYPGDEAYAGTSSINWFTSGITLANNVYTAFSTADGSIRVRCGGGGASTHFIIDLVAALIVFDFGAGVGGARTTPQGLPIGPTRSRWSVS